MSKYDDDKGADYLRYQKNNFITSINTEINRGLANAKAIITDGNNAMIASFNAMKIKLESYLASDTGLLQVKNGSITLLPNLWIPALGYIPTQGLVNTLISLKISCTLPVSSATVGYVGIVASNDTITSPSSLSAMPFYMEVKGAQAGTAYTSIDSYTLSSSVLEPTGVTLDIPLNARMSSLGLMLYIRTKGTAGFSFNTIKAIYRSDRAI